MHSPVIKGRDESFTSVIRWGLLVWAILRLIVSVLLTGTLIAALKSTYDEPNFVHYNENLRFFQFAILVHLVELGMLGTFIAAGIKKKVSLYRAYYRYCILTLVIYITVVILSTILDYYGVAHYFMKVYITYHIDEWPIIGDAFNFYGAFILAVIIDSGLEILLIVSIKKLIQTYSYSFTPPVNV